MIAVSKIILINWYAFGSEEIELRGDAAFVGDNGAGKSSILDAVLLALTGGDSRYWRPNARAEDDRKQQGRRTVRDYCLGKMTGLDAEEPLRKGGTSYVVLIASDAAGLRRLSFGIAMYADGSSPNADIEGRFVASGVGLCAADLHQGGALGAGAAPWPEARNSIERLARKNGGGVQLFEQPGTYVRSLLQHVRGRAGQANPNHWLRAMRLAASFRGVDSPDDFVRMHILPENSIDLPALRDDVRRYRGIVADIKRLEAKERELSVVRGAFDEHFAALSRKRIAALLGGIGRLEQASRKVESGELDTRKYGEAVKRLAAIIERQGHDIEACREQVNAAKGALDGDPSQARLLEAKLRHRDAAGRLSQAKSDLAARRSAISAVHDALAASASAGVPAAGLAATFQSALDPDAGGAWPRDLQTAVLAARAGPSLADVQSRLSDQNATRLAALAAADEKAKNAVGRLEDARSGGFRLRGETKALLEALTADRMNPVPLCAVAEVTDPEWAAAAETLLGAGRDAILVERRQVRDAIKRVRRERARFYDCTIVQVGGMERHGGVPRPDSLAAVIRTDDPRARAFVNLRLGGITCVRTEAELETAGRAVTPDCQYASGGGVQNRRPVTELTLGKRWAASDIAQLTAERDAAMEARQAAEARLNESGRAMHRLEAAISGLTSLGDLEALASRRDEADVAANEAARLVALAEAAVPAELEQDFRQLGEELAERLKEREIDAARKEIDSTALVRATLELEKAREDFIKREAGLADLPAQEGERAVAEAELAERLAGRHGLSLVLEDAQRREIDSGREAERLRVAADNKLNAYWHRHDELPADAPGAPLESLGVTEGKARWVAQRLERLASHELRRHKEAAEQAEAKVSQGLRQDLFLMLAARVDEGQRLILDLNRHLRHRPFHGEIYSFQRIPRPEHDEILKAAEAVRRNASLADEGQATSGDEVVDRGRRRVLALLDEDGPNTDAEIRLLADYRQYFSYDVEMRSERGALVGRLSQRLRTGSGGEREAPSYAAVGTAVAAANNIQPGARAEDIGMALALFDEAFTRLDDANIGSVLDLMRTLRLQLLVAAPTSKWLAFASRFETVVTVMRFERSVTLVIHHSNEEFRAKLRADNPFEMSLEQWEARSGRHRAAK